jgi:FemAB-related protein (PEP-CTERM system-associated)
VELRVISSVDYEAWDRYICARAPECVYLTTAWKQAIDTSYRHKNFYFGIFDSKRLVGILPLVLIKAPLGCPRLVSLPYCDYGGLLADTSVIAEALIDKAVDQAKQLHAALEIRVPAPCIVMEQALGFYQSTTKCRMILELRNPSDLLWDSFTTKLRTKVRRTMKNGFDFQMGKEELLSDFYHVFSRNMRDLGSPVHSIHWLRSVLVAFDDRARIGVVYKDSFPVAAGIILSHGNAVTNPWASALREYDKLRPNTLLYWNLLKYASDNGFTFFDFGRSTPGNGTYDFKRQWGAVPMPLYWYKQGSHVRRKVRSGVDVPMRSVLEWAWRKLPVSVANVLGPPIRKQISR